MGNTYSSTVHQNANRFDIKSLDSKELFNLPENYTWEELKSRYKQLALKVHPDKGGDRDTFNYITHCFQELSKELSRREHDKQHSELKQQFEKDHKEYSYNINPKIFEASNNEQFIDKFNRFFEENRFEDDTEHGYGDMMAKSDKNRDDIDIKNIFGSTEVNPRKFNEVFENKVPVNKKELTKYKEPEPMTLKPGLSYSLLGVKTNDYTGETESKNLTYTDYMRAYTEQRTPTDVNRKEFKSVKEYERYRERSMNNPVTDKERKRMEARRMAEENEEQKRLSNLRRQDEAIESYYSKISKMNLTA